MKSATFGTLGGQKLGKWRFLKFTFLLTLGVHEILFKFFSTSDSQRTFRVAFKSYDHVFLGGMSEVNGGGIPHFGRWKHMFFDVSRRVLAESEVKNIFEKKIVDHQGTQKHLFFWKYWYKFWPRCAKSVRFHRFRHDLGEQFPKNMRFTPWK